MDGGAEMLSISINYTSKGAKKQCDINILLNFEKDSFIPVLYAIAAKYFGLEYKK